MISGEEPRHSTSKLEPPMRRSEPFRRRTRSKRCAPTPTQSNSHSFPWHTRRLPPYWRSWALVRRWSSGTLPDDVPFHIFWLSFLWLSICKDSQSDLPNALHVPSCYTPSRSYLSTKHHSYQARKRSRVDTFGISSSIKHQNIRYIGS